MRKWAFLILVLPLLLSRTAFGQPAKHVVIVSIDGLRPEFYLDPSWGMVNLRLDMKKGAYAKGVNSVFPSVTFPSHTSMMTGVFPAKHGIYYNTTFDPQTDSIGLNWYYRAIQAPTLWEAVHEAGMTSASVFWPVSVGAPVDYNVPAFKKSGVSQLAATAPYCTPKGLLEEVQQFATGKMEDADFEKKKDYLAEDQTMARIGAYLIRKYKPALTTIHISCVDHFEHVQGRDGEMVKRAVAGADRAIRTIVESVERAGISEHTTIIVTGDHGHVNKNTTICPNVWLSKAGLMQNAKQGDWKAQFYSAGGSTFLYLNDTADSKTLAKVQALLKELPVGIRRCFRVLDREELIAAGADPHAALALIAHKGVAFGNKSEGEVLLPAHGSGHGYFPDFPEIQTGFVAFGAGIRSGSVIPEMDVIDVAPMVAYLLGIDFPSADGILIKGVLQ